MGGAQRAAAMEAKAEKERRDEEKKAFKAAQELESLRRAFKRIDKKGDGSIDVDELMAELQFLGHAMKASEAALTIWEVDDDADGCIDWNEFRTMFYRVRDDQTGYEPRKLFSVVEFLMHDKNLNGSIDLDECMSILYNRYGKEPVDEAFSEMEQRSATEKSVNFTTFVTASEKASKKIKTTGLKPGATMVPQVKGANMISQDPSLAHLL